jgi:hypothetical protein
MDLSRVKYGSTIPFLKKGKINILSLVKNSTFPVNSLIRALSPIKDHLLERQVVSDEIAGFMNDNPILLEGFVEGLTNELMGQVENHLSLTPSEGDRLLDLIKTISNQQQGGFTATVANGQSFSLIIVDETLPTGEQILIRSAGDFNDIMDAVLYKTEDGRFRLNPVIKPLNWEADILSDALMPDLSIFEILMEVIRRLEPDYDHEDMSIRDILLRISYYCRVKDREYTNMVDYVSKLIKGLLGFVPNNANLKQLVVILSKALVVEYALSHIRSKRVHIVTYFKDMLVNSSIQEVLIEGVDAIRGGFDAVTTFIGSIDSWIRNAAASVQHVFKVLVKAFQQGGIVGMASAIVQLYSSPTNSIVSDDGLLQFTDNEKLMPKEYIAGIIAVVVTVVTGIAALIASIFNPVIGAIAAAVGTVFYGIIQSFTMDWNGTFCQAEINVSREIMDNFPVGLFQSEISFDTLGIPEEEITELSEVFSGANYVTVPGGILLIGASPAEQVFRFEFHPGIHHTRFDLLFEAKLIDYEILLPIDGGWMHGFLMKGRHYPVPTINILDTLDYLEIDSLLIDGEGYYKGKSDAYLSIAYSANIAAFLLFVHLAALHGDNIYEYKVPASGYIGNMFAGPWKDGRHVDLSVEFKDNLYAVFYSPLADDLLRRSHYYQAYYDYFAKFTGWDEAVQFAVDSTFAVDDEFPSLIPRSFGFSLMHINSEDWDTGMRKDANGNYTILPELINSPYSSFHIVMGDIGAIMTHRIWAGGVTDVTSNMLWAVKMPKWNRRTFIAWVALATLVTAVVVATTAIITVRVKRAIQTARAESTRKVESAWEKYTDAENPAEAQAAYQTYRKAVRTANLKAKFIGGTRYDISGYWNGDPTESQEGPGGETSERTSGLQRILGQIGEPDTSGLLLANALHTSTILSYIDKVDLSTPNDDVLDRASTSLETYSRSIKIK